MTAFWALIVGGVLGALAGVFFMAAVRLGAHADREIEKVIEQSNAREAQERWAQRLAQWREAQGKLNHG